MGTWVSFVCVAPEHQQRRLSAGFAITMHDGGWAYCAGGDRTDHEWRRLDHPRTIADVEFLRVPGTAA